MDRHGGLESHGLSFGEYRGDPTAWGHDWEGKEWRSGGGEECVKGSAGKETKIEGKGEAKARSRIRTLPF